MLKQLSEKFTNCIQILVWFRKGSRVNQNLQYNISKPFCFKIIIIKGVLHLLLKISIFVFALSKIMNIFLKDNL